MRWTALAVTLAIVGLVYAPGLDGPFVFDDFPNFVRDLDVQPRELGYADLRAAAYAGDRDWPHRALSYLSFAANFVLSGGGFSPLAMKATNLAIHLVNATLVYLLFSRLVPYLLRPDVRRPLPPSWIALAAAGLWALHPLNLTSVLYTVQRMTSLSALCVLAALNLYLIGRERLERQSAGATALLLTALMLACLVGFLFKENALLFLAFALLLEAFCFSSGWRLELPAAVGKRALFVAAIFAGAACVLVLSSLVVIWAASGYGGRDFDIAERLMTQSRVLAQYAQMFVFPASHLFGLHHDDFEISRSLTQPISTLVAILAWTLACGAAWIAAQRRPVWLFGLLWFVVGHAMESTILPLELVHEHRNYLPIVGPAFAVAYYVTTLSAATRAPAVCASAVLLVLACLMGGVTAVRAGHWSDAYTLMAIGVAQHPESSRYNSAFAVEHLRATGDIETAIVHFKKAARLDPRDVGSLASAYAHVKSGLAQMEAAVDAQKTGALTGAKDSSGDSTSELPLAYMGRLENELGELEREITQRLRTQSFDAQMLTTIMLLQKCVASGRPECAAMKDEARSWLEIALSNPALGGTWRAQVLYGRGVLAGNEGEFEQAIQLWIRALELDPRLPVVRMSLADVSLALGRPREAREHLAGIADSEILNARQRAQFEALRARAEQ